jgi:uncharacterized protein YbbC (DUF1343 family)
MPSLQAALVYPGACLLEGTNLSEGRGTTLPFQTMGAPFLDGKALVESMGEIGAPGALIHPVSFKSTFGKHEGRVCHGVRVHVTDAHLFRPVATYLRLIALARAQANDAFAFERRTYEFESDRLAFDLLTGSTAVREALESGAGAEEVVDLLCPVDAEYRAGLDECERRAQRASP